MKHVHWIGTGLSSIPGIRRLAKNLDNFTVWNRTLDKAIKSIDHVDKNNVNAKQFDIDLLFNEGDANDVDASTTAELLRNQYRPMKKGVSNMVKLHATGAVAMPIETRLHLLASSKDVIHS